MGPNHFWGGTFITLILLKFSVDPAWPQHQHFFAAFVEENIPYQFIVECKNILSMKIRILLQKGFQPIVFRLPASQPAKKIHMNEHLFHTCPSITKNLYHKHCGTFYQIFVYNLKNMTEKLSSLYVYSQKKYLSFCIF